MVKDPVILCIESEQKCRADYELNESASSKEIANIGGGKVSGLVVGIFIRLYMIGSTGTIGGGHRDWHYSNGRLKEEVLHDMLLVRTDESRVYSGLCLLWCSR